MRMHVGLMNILSRVLPRGQSALGAGETGSGTDYVFVQIIEECSYCE